VRDPGIGHSENPQWKIVELAVRDVVHGRAVENREALANPEALDLFASLPELES